MKLRFESLEPRWVLTAGFSNPFNAVDVDDDGIVGSADALLVINAINASRDANDLTATAGVAPFLDVSGDGQVAPIDALLVINHINSRGGTRAPLVFSLSPNDDPDGNGVVLRATVTIQGQAGGGSKVRLLKSSGEMQMTTADSMGRFDFRLDLSRGSNPIRVDAVDEAGQAASVQGEIRYGDVVLDWNAALLTIVRDWTTLSNDPYSNRVVTSPPPVVARNLAMVHAAMFDAINSVRRTYQPYHVDVTAPPDTSETAAAAAAAQRVAETIYTKPDELAIINAAMAEALSIVPDGPAKTQGQAVGEQVGDAIAAWRKDDGASSTVTYTPGNKPGEWQRTFPDYYPPLLPQWPNVTPFAMAGPAQFRPGPPPALNSAEYAAAVDEVQRLGAYSSSERTAEQTEIALFWSDGGGTFTPPGHWNQIAADVALAQGSSLVENARLFAMLDVALADAGIACWDAKYAYDFWRPIAAIREADTDGNAATLADPSWTPLIRTPNFPTYTSGHSTFSAAAVAVLDAVFGSDVAFTSVADDHSGFRERPLAIGAITTRSFRSFDQAADEAGRSRIYGGIHYSFDNIQGQAMGKAIGKYVVTNFFGSEETGD